MGWKSLSLAAAVVVTAFGYWIYPYWTLSRIQRAIIDRDPVAIEALIDWQGLRADFRADARTLFVSGSADQSPEAATFGTVLGSMMVDQLVDTKVNPAGFLELITENKFFAGRSPSDFLVGAGFAGLTLYRAKIKHPDTGPELTATAILEFSGLSWRLTKVILPIPAITDAIAKSRRPPDVPAAPDPARAWAPGPGGTTPFYSPGESRPLFK